jgi:hypothetical protein
MTSSFGGARLEFMKDFKGCFIIADRLASKELVPEQSGNRVGPWYAF